MTVAELTEHAGGFAESAKTDNIKVVRKETGGIVQFRFNHKDFVQGKNPQQNIALKNGDIVIVP